MGAMRRVSLALLAGVSYARGELAGQCSSPHAVSDPACSPPTDANEEASVLQVKGRNKQHSSIGSRLIVKNGCASEPMWIASMFRDADRERYPNNFKLEPGEEYTFNMPADQTVVATRFWPKLGCDANGENCRLGSSGGPGQGGCPRNGCAPPVDSKFEATWWDKNTAEPVDWWDTSGVDGYTVPYTLTLDSNCPRGTSLDCSRLSLDDCPTDEVLNGKKTDLTVRFEGGSGSERVGCYSPCGKLTYSNWGNTATSPASMEAGPYCCPTPPVSVEACRTGPVEETKWVALFRKKCRAVYSYAYDDAMGLQTCPVGTTYSWTLLCPLWSSANLTRDGSQD